MTLSVTPSRLLDASRVSASTTPWSLAADAVAKRALARYPQPKGIPLESQLSMRYVFTIE
jgi:hypothetical protein